MPDEPFLVALETAAVRGARVHIVVPERSNKPVTQGEQRSHYERLLEAGVRIHFHASHFFHAKHGTGRRTDRREWIGQLFRDDWRRRPVLAKIKENTARLADVSVRLKTYLMGARAV